ncbi:hypothetical protein CC86DRAFT_409368 [Ophiobolus disseminans]|uniref:Uncharacterized protein n=1 Tax=Ophiobolus disseminans TaxID=1469910 RepID=A0A6A6ZRN8_9PLEO|nr:hypothetical protein CC86DRAFT_409368 [Ophiobolus disseminans]
MAEDDVSGSASEQAGDRPVTNTPSEEPYRPRLCQDMLKFFPALKEYMTRIEWADGRIEGLSAKKTDAERAQTLAEEKIVALTADLQTQTKLLDELRSQQAFRAQEVQKSLKENEGWFNKKLEHLAKRQQEVKAIEANTERPKTGLKADQNLFDAIENLGAATKKARRERSNLVAGKKRPEQAFAKWENAYCKPSLDVVHLAKKVKDDRDRYHRDRIEQLDMLVRREEKINLLEELADNEKEKRDREYKANLHAFAKEKEDWRSKRAQKLEGEELEAVREVWLKVQKHKVRAQIWDEADKESYLEAEKLLQEKHDAQCAVARHEGSKEGYANLEQARAEGYEEAKEAAMLSNSEACSDAYERGADDGKEEGHLAGRLEAKEETDKAHGETFRKAFHWRVLSSDWAKSELVKADGTANLTRAYWFERTTAHFATSEGRYRLSDPTSPWYNSDKKGNTSSLKIRRFEYGLSEHDSYHAGVWDGLFGHNNRVVLLPNWHPPEGFR